MIESHVTSLELSKKLEALGVKQESYFLWVNNPYSDNENYKVKPYFQETTSCNYLAAYLSSELGEMLPKGHWQIESTAGGFRSWYEDKHYTWHENLAESLGGLLCYLIENNLIKL
jgi:hypothetical protein